MRNGKNQPARDRTKRLPPTGTNTRNSGKCPGREQRIYLTRREPKYKPTLLPMAERNTHNPRHSEPFGSRTNLQLLGNCIRRRVQRPNYFLQSFQTAHRYLTERFLPIGRRKTLRFTNRNNSPIKISYNCRKMVYQVLSAFAEGLSGHLSRVFSLRDDIVRLSAPEGQNGPPLPNKLTVTLINVERETAAGITFANRSAGERLTKSSPPWQMNLYVMVAALFVEKRYAEGLRFLSESLRYIQNNAVFTVAPLSEMLTIEPVNLSISELSNIWSICGGSYRPSVLCKIRVVQLSSNEIRATATPVTQKETEL